MHSEEALIMFLFFPVGAFCVRSMVDHIGVSVFSFSLVDMVNSSHTFSYCSPTALLSPPFSSPRATAKNTPTTVSLLSQ
jgi:hypothetical protein